MCDQLKITDIKRERRGAGFSGSFFWSTEWTVTQQGRQNRRVVTGRRGGQW